MFPGRVSNLGPLALESDALPTVLHGPNFLCPRHEMAEGHI